MAVVPTLAQMIADAQLALHRLQIGQAAVRVKTADQEIEFRAADVNKLQEYLDRLQAQQDGCTPPRAGSIGFVFALLLAVLTAMAPSPARAAGRDAGPDLPWPCWVVRTYVRLYTPAQLEEMARRHGVVLTPKQRRQAAECLR